MSEGQRQAAEGSGEVGRCCRHNAGWHDPDGCRFCDCDVSYVEAHRRVAALERPDASEAKWRAAEIAIQIRASRRDAGAVIARLLAEAEARGHARGVAEAGALREKIRKLAVQYETLSDELHLVPAANAFHDAALDLRRALGGDA